MKKTTDDTNMDELIAGYFAQELDAMEINTLRNWLHVSGENKKYFEQKQEVWFAAIGADGKFRFDTEKAFKLFLTRKAIATSQKQTQHIKGNFILILQRVAAVAAILLLFAGSGYWLGTGKIKGLIAENVVVEAPLGSRAKLYLPDGTLVWLNAGSTISYSQNFGVEDRTVNLKGEGYFEVTSNEKKPFYVKTNDLNVRVLGTKFNFRNYIDEGEARITLLEGRVRVNSKSGSNLEAFLNPNEQMVFDKELLRARVTQTKASNASEWTKGLIFFDEERLPDIVRELERSYNVKINIADDSLHSYRFYGNFTRTEQTIQEVLDVLASTDKLKYEMLGKEITLRLK
ncbi:MAG: DUF4974 domain-containing protein [Paludibacter sp.]|nr:DUF4974 domain-containing protein [Paludibacter sp.]